MEMEEEKEERAVWNAEHDICLTSIVTTYGSQNWTAIAESMNVQFPDYRKSGKQCRERWYNKLDPNIKHAPWTKQEEAALILHHMRLKNRWADISGKFNGRTNNMVKNRFYSIFRKVKNKTKNFDFAYNSRLELIEMYYMISVMEDYAANPLSPEEPKRKRGKDFMYTLIEDLDMSQLAAYKQALQRRCPLKQPIEGQLEELSSTALLNPGATTTVRTIPMFSAESPEPGLRPQHPMTSHVAMQDSPTPHSASPMRRHFLTLPEPSSYVVKEMLTPEDKEFVMANAFHVPSTAPSGDPILPGPLFRPPRPTGYPSFGYCSSGTGKHFTNVHPFKGGFEDYSQGALVVPRPGPPFMTFTPPKPNPSLFSPMYPGAVRLTPPQ